MEACEKKHPGWKTLMEGDNAGYIRDNIMFIEI
jgi:hypothetical protein